MTTEASANFPCFGSTCSVHVIGAGHAGDADEAVAWAQGELEGWHHQFSRFEPGSELSRLNADHRHAVPVSPVMARFAEVVVQAGALTGGLVDATLLDEIVAVGYAGDLAAPAPGGLGASLGAAPVRRPAAASADARWRLLRVDRGENVVIRPPGVHLDSGGLAKGLFCDLLAEVLDTHDAFAIDCAGDVLVGGAAGVARPIHVGSPFGEGTLHSYESAGLAAATSGIGRRSWVGHDGAPAHHLLDPSTGMPAFTGIVQVTALATTATLAEICAKAAILAGPEAAAGWLPHGGVIVYDDGSFDEVPAS